MNLEMYIYEFLKENVSMDCNTYVVDPKVKKFNSCYNIIGNVLEMRENALKILCE